MSESSVHMHYVNQLLLFAKKLIPEDKHSFIFVDQPDSFQKPPRTNLNFIPDLYYRLNDFLVIGEAKTYGDVDTKHSRSQYEDYYNDALGFEGKAIMIFSVPLAAKGTIKNIMRRITGTKNGKVTIYFVSDLGIVETI